MKVVFIATARILATFDVLPPVDENGNIRMPPAEFTRDLVRYAKFCTLSSDAGPAVSHSTSIIHYDSHPLPFECIVKPRSERSMMLVGTDLAGKS